MTTRPPLIDPQIIATNARALEVRRSRGTPSALQWFSVRVEQWLEEAESTESLCGHQRRIVGVLRPSTVEHVQQILAAAASAGPFVKIQATSCGRNWGFGSQLPVGDGVFLLDLSKLNRIRSSTIEAHSVEIEPGVTQGELDRWLAVRGRTHYFNVTGAGTTTSVIGNALERGIGYSGSRHLDLLELELILPGGRLAKTSKHSHLSSSGYGAILGSGVTELFCQSNLGVVTAARIALYRRPKRMGAVVCKVRKPELFAPLVATIADLAGEGACYGVPHIFNRERILNSFAPHLDDAGLQLLAASAADWTALLPIKGAPTVFDASAASLGERLTCYGDVEIIADSADSNNAKLSYLLQGRPTDFSHASVAYAVFGKATDTTVPLEKTGAGLIHVTPLIPLSGDAPQRAIELACSSLQRSGYAKPQLSLNLISPRVAALVIPIGFDRRSSSETHKAQTAATNLLTDFSKAGMLPYRLGLDQALLLPLMDEPWPEIFRGIQQIFDPSHCMAESRYQGLWDVTIQETERSLRGGV